VDQPAHYAPDGAMARPGTTNLPELVERILDKGIVVAGDITVNLVDIELLTIKLRLVIASVDKAREIGINWWESDPWLSSQARDGERTSEELGQKIMARLDDVERSVRSLQGAKPAGQRAVAQKQRARQ
jgi:hypothetical protein